MLLVVLAAPALAGCLTSSVLGGGTLTAQEAAGLAEARARQWDPDARLAGVAGIEARQGSPFHENATGEQCPPGSTECVPKPWPEPDGNVGDGRATMWLFEFLAGNGTGALEVAVYGNRTVLAEEGEGGRGKAALTGWQVDSPRAVEVAMEDANFSAAVRAPDGGLVMVLGAPDDDGDDDADANDTDASAPEDPFWVLMTGSEQAATGAIVFVNARTGERMPFPMLPGFGGLVGFPFPVSPGGCPFSSAQADGSLQLGQSSTLELDVAPECTRLDLRLEWEGTAPTDRAVVELRDPRGEVVRPDEEDEGEGTYTARYTAVGPGTYEATVSAVTEAPGGVDAPVATSVDYELVVQTS